MVEKLTDVQLAALHALLGTFSPIGAPSPDFTKKHGEAIAGLHTITLETERKVRGLSDRLDVAEANIVEARSNAHAANVNAIGAILIALGLSWCLGVVIERMIEMDASIDSLKAALGQSGVVLPFTRSS